jgi:hypothetical protein
MLPITAMRGRDSARRARAHSRRSRRPPYPGIAQSWALDRRAQCRRGVCCDLQDGTHLRDAARIPAIGCGVLPYPRGVRAGSLRSRERPIRRAAAATIRKWPALLGKLDRIDPSYKPPASDAAGGERAGNHRRTLFADDDRRVGVGRGHQRRRRGADHAQPCEPVTRSRAATNSSISHTGPHTTLRAASIRSV